MRTIVILFFALLSSFASAQSLEQNVYSVIDSFNVNEFNSRTQIALAVYDLQKDSLLFATNEKLLLHPGSNQKILTTAAALLFLNEEYEFTTGLYYDGEISGSVLKGNLYLKGGLDPDLRKEELELFLDEIKDKGIETIEGNIYADVSLMDDNFWGQGWMWDDDPWSDFPYFTALNINDDCVKIVIAPTAIGKKASVKIYPPSLFYTFENNLITHTLESHYTVMRNWKNRSNHFAISGSINVSEEPDTMFLNLTNTNYYAVTLMKEILYREEIITLGITDTSVTPEDAVLLGEIKRTLGEVIINLNKNSDNLSAEMVLRALSSLNMKSRYSAKGGIYWVDSLITLAGFNPKNYRIVDGSGVSHYNLVTVELIIGILKYFYKEKPKLFDLLYNSFPVAGVDGTLKRRMKSGYAFGNVKAKTGTLSGVSALSGFVKNKSGGELAFSIFVQNFVGSTRRARNLQDRICEILAGSEL